MIDGRECVSLVLGYLELGRNVDMSSVYGEGG